MTQGTFFGLITVVLLILFLGIVVWAYSKNRKQDFEQAANLPLEDDRPAEERSSGGKDHE